MTLNTYNVYLQRKQLAMSINRVLLVTLLSASSALAQETNDPFPEPISSTAGVIQVNFSEFASVPDIDGQPARMMLLSDEPGTGRLFVNDMRGQLYSIDYDGQRVTQYLDIDDADWGVGVQSSRNELGFQSFAFHPEFNRSGTDGFGKFYTWTDSRNTAPDADFIPGGGGDTHDTVLLEWTARNPSAGTYDGDAPRELLRLEQPYGNLSQNLNSAFGKIFRIDPLGSNSMNRSYGIPADNPFANDGDNNTLSEIYASGVRNPQRFAWDPDNGNMFLADIGQNIVEEISLVTSGANLGWNTWEGSFRFISRSAVSLNNPRGDEALTYPVAEYGQEDPLLQRSSAATGLHVYRSDAIPELANLVLFGDNPSGEVFYVSADLLPSGGQQAIRRILLNDSGDSKTLLQVIQEKNREQGRSPASRVDLRFGSGPDGQVFLLNKRDGVIRLLVPSAGSQ